MDGWLSHSLPSGWGVGVEGGGGGVLGRGDEARELGRVARQRPSRFTDCQGGRTSTSLAQLEPRGTDITMSQDGVTTFCRATHLFGI